MYKRFTDYVKSLIIFSTWWVILNNASIIHRTLTWTTGSLTCVCNLSFCRHDAWVTLVNSLTQRTVLLPFQSTFHTTCTGEVLLYVLRCQLTYHGQAVTNAEARFNNSLRPRKPEGSLGRTAQDGHLDSHTAPELCTICTWVDAWCPQMSVDILGTSCDQCRSTVQ